MTRMDVNIPLMRKTVEWVEEQERLDPRSRTWFQPLYAVPEGQRVRVFDHEQGCGTAYCFAGKVVSDVYPEYRDGMRTPDNRSVVHVANELLGITFEEGCTLYNDSNSAADIRTAAEAIVGERL